jgi:hypothetical protein
MQALTRYSYFCLIETGKHKFRKLQLQCHRTENGPVRHWMTSQEHLMTGQYCRFLRNLYGLDVLPGWQLKLFPLTFFQPKHFMLYFFVKWAYDR